MKENFDPNKFPSSMLSALTDCRLLHVLVTVIDTIDVLIYI